MSAPTSTQSQKDMDVLIAAWKTAKVAPQLDYKALADLGFYKNANSARACFDALKKRVFGPDYSASNHSGAGNDAAATGGAKKKPATPRKRKTKETERAPVNGDADEANGEGDTPAKKAKQEGVKDE
ncbi:hypothetical protein MN608_00710 [Microdochium nivale]|nr:hypothetical protein MN608_00710 [Microdochium nivale]